MTLGALNESQGLLAKLLDLPLPFGLAYNINLLVNKLQPSLEFYQAELKKLLDTYAEKDSENHYKYTAEGDLQLKVSTANEFKKKFEELIATKVGEDVQIFTAEDCLTLERAGLIVTPREVTYYKYFMK